MATCGLVVDKATGATCDEPDAEWFVLLQAYYNPDRPELGDGDEGLFLCPIHLAAMTAR